MVQFSTRSTNGYEYVNLTFKRALVALSISASLALPVSAAFAGTTGGVNGTVTDADTKAALAGAKVTASSPSQTASVVADSSGRYSFVNLAPDTYTITAEKDGYQAGKTTDVVVYADQQATVDVAESKGS